MPQVYDPLFVDDPGLTTGKHRTVMNLPSFKASIIPYVKASDLKSELNKQFRCVLCGGEFTREALTRYLGTSTRNSLRT